MGNSPSSSARHHQQGGGASSRLNGGDFPGSAFVDSMINQCGSLNDTDNNSINVPDATDGGQQQTEQEQFRASRDRSGHRRRSTGHNIRKGNDPVSTLLAKTDELCNMSPTESVVKNGFGVGVGGREGVGKTDHPWKTNSDFDEEYEEFGMTPRNNAPPAPATTEDRNPGSSSDNDNTAHSTSSLFAKALVSEVTGNPKTMTPQAMAEREFRLLKAQEKARQAKKAGGSSHGVRPIGSPTEGIGTPNILGSLAHVLGTNPSSASGEGAANTPGSAQNPSIVPPDSLSENRATVTQAASMGTSNSMVAPLGKYTVTIGLSLSRRSVLGHPDTVTRQTAFDFNELQDREYKYVSSTDASGWKAGGGERGGVVDLSNPPQYHQHSSDPATPITNMQESQKVAAPDTVHIPIIHIDAGNQQNVDAIISALARGEVFIPHMAVIPESLSVNGVSPPDLVVRFGTERNEDLPPDEWPNWCIEFMHNQLYEYFQGMGARWMKRPFSITLARKVRWKTVKHMNKYFAHAERVIDAWREKGPQYLDPQLAYIEGGATPEEVAHPHGIYLMRNGVPTNYFAPNFDPPYTTKMTRSLLLNVLGKSWDKRRREWSSEPIPKLLTPSMLVTAMFGCTDSQAGGFIATEATKRHSFGEQDDSVLGTTLPDGANIRTYENDALVAATQNDRRQRQEQERPIQYFSEQQQQQQQHQKTSYHDMDGTPSNASPTAHDLRNLSSASGVPTPTSNQQYAPQNDYDQDRIMAMADNHSTQPSRQQDPSRGVSAPMKVMTNLNNNLAGDDGATYTSKSTMSAVSANSSKYNKSRPTPEKMMSHPTPEKMISPLQSSSVFTNQQVVEDLENSLREHRMLDNQDQENANPAKKMSTPTPSDTPLSASVGQRKDSVQSFVGGNNSCTLVHKHAQRETEPTKTPSDRNEKTPEGLSCDEDWLDDMENENQPTPAENSKKNAYSSKRQRIKQALARENQRHFEMTATGQEPPAGKSSPSIRKNYSGHSGVSLEYSIDSAGNTIGESTVGSSLLGQHIETGTVASNCTRDTRGRNERTGDDAIPEGHPSAEGSNGSSEDSDEPPSDEELFKVGWAKALDANSGSYYYFTLDRSKIVWDNPLSENAEDDESTTLGELEYEESEVNVPPQQNAQVIRL
mmetsp:Transcript_26221/g.62310  ORF Transcript_26221/g.62310 Transcript_26221/m.62310 type:complete len:1149 (+) Transcript_26221:338-3784(+)